MSPNARDKAARERELESLHDWRDERDRDADDIPEPEPDLPVHTLE